MAEWKESYPPMFVGASIGPFSSITGSDGTHREFTIGSAMGVADKKEQTSRWIKYF